MLWYLIAARPAPHLSVTELVAETAVAVTMFVASRFYLRRIFLSRRLTLRTTGVCSTIGITVV